MKMPLPEFKQLVDDAKLKIREISPEELKHMLEVGEDFTMIDVREPDEHAGGTIPGAVTMPRGILERDIDTVTTEESRKIVVYCAGGARSALAALSLKNMGFNDVISLAGGFGHWRELQ
jgi:sulfur-carrier protein adenylyltransferase/sulfurtransferase